MIEDVIIEQEYELAYKSSFNNPKVPQIEDWILLKVYSSLEEVKREIGDRLNKKYKPIKIKKVPTIVITFEMPSLNPNSELTQYYHLRIMPRLKLKLKGLEKKVE